MVVHPEVGKWLIALGEKAFGMDPFGWRVAAAVVGALMVLVMCRLVRRLTGSTLLGCVAGLLLCFDGLHLVLSRLALLDIFLSFFLLLRRACLVIDRDWTRARMAAAGRREPVDEPDGWGPWGPTLLVPAVAGCWPACASGWPCGTKWSAIYPLAAFGLLVWFWNAGARRSLGRALAAAEVGRRRRRTGLRAPGRGRLRRVRRDLDRLADPRARVRGHLSNTQYTRFKDWAGECKGKKMWTRVLQVEGVVDRERARRARPRRGWSSHCGRWGYYHHDVYVFHTEFLNGSTHIYAVRARRLAAAQPAGRGRRRARHQARHAGLRGGRRTATACARCC